MTDDEKTFWRIYASLQELLRVTDEDISKNPDLKQLLTSVSNVGLLYRKNSADSILVDQRMRDLAERGIPTIGPKKKK